MYKIIWSPGDYPNLNYTNDPFNIKSSLEAFRNATNTPISKQDFDTAIKLLNSTLQVKLESPQFWLDIIEGLSLYWDKNTPIKSIDQIGITIKNFLI